MHKTNPKKPNQTNWKDTRPVPTGPTPKLATIWNSITAIESIFSIQKS